MCCSIRRRRRKRQIFPKTPGRFPLFLQTHILKKPSPQKKQPRLKGKKALHRTPPADAAVQTGAERILPPLPEPLLEKQREKNRLSRSSPIRKPRRMRRPITAEKAVVRDPPVHRTEKKNKRRKMNIRHPPARRVRRPVLQRKKAEGADFTTAAKNPPATAALLPCDLSNSFFL